MPVSTRIATPADAALLNALAAATFGLACPPGTTAESVAEFVATHLSAEHFVGYLADPLRELIVVERDATPAGYSMLVYSDSTDPDVVQSLTARPSAELSKLYVLEGHHGAGVGAALMEASVTAAEQRGFAGVWLGVNQLNERANRFYERQQFRIVGEKKFALGDSLEEDWVRERIIRLTP
ncbi:ribosomal protein S18 acetylase RimI-like enzyme [Glaciihabitans tibetensis]|uniref:Ribosomal protein S18 acetylase RimI-like enzyme n=1 Tax=Glaciihabitans tibetensis TaxID=1266600 RepID=A0A2T0V732_9MICO|nr:GNAT family N-acetyltransferase [Glaciihabitans tibetensis]PRY65986.1 ribosomal protein S18 acetylase RimI-like enzyme [Glaciihabitans tibetensis]